MPNGAAHALHEMTIFQIEQLVEARRMFCRLTPPTSSQLLQVYECGCSIYDLPSSASSSLLRLSRRRTAVTVLSFRLRNVLIGLSVGLVCADALDYSTAKPMPHISNGHDLETRIPSWCAFVTPSPRRIFNSHNCDDASMSLFLLLLPVVATKARQL